MIKGETKVAALGTGPVRGSRSGYWLIAKNDNGRMEALTIDLAGQETIPIFSFRDEAEMYLRFEGCDEWWVRETSAGELISLLFGPYLRVKKVALDPLPEICDEGMNCLLSVSRKNFARTLSATSLVRR
jgi:hypothetical protein